MDKINKKLFAMARQYTDETVEGAEGVIAGKNCQIVSKEKIVDGEGSRTLVTFAWFKDGETEARTDTIEVWDGEQGEKGDEGEQGAPGTSAEVTVKETPPGIYILHVKSASGEFDTPNLKGANGGVEVQVDNETLLFIM